VLLAVSPVKGQHLPLSAIQKLSYAYSVSSAGVSPLFAVASKLASLMLATTCKGDGISPYLLSIFFLQPAFPLLPLWVSAFGRLSFRSIHSLKLGEQHSTGIHFASHALRKRTPSTSTRSNSCKSKSTRGPPTLDLGLHLIQVLRAKLSARPNPRFSHIRRWFDLQCHRVLAPKRTHSYECSHGTILKSLKRYDLGLPPILIIEEFLNGEEARSMTLDAAIKSVRLSNFEPIDVDFQALDFRVERPRRQA
jgi:hypothetical protein